jgi:hypothetical protein
MTTGLDMVAVGGCTGFDSEFKFGTFLFIDFVCVSASTVAGLGLRGEGLDRVRVPMFLDLVLRDEGGDC